MSLLALTVILEGTTDTELAYVQLPDIQEKYGYPHCVGHRATLAGLDSCPKANPVIGCTHGDDQTDRAIGCGPLPVRLVDGHYGAERPRSE